MRKSAFEKWWDNWTEKRKYEKGEFGPKAAWLAALRWASRQRRNRMVDDDIIDGAKIRAELKKASEEK